MNFFDILQAIITYPVACLVVWSLIDSFFTLRWTYKYQEKERKEQKPIRVVTHNQDKSSKDKK